MIGNVEDDLIKIVPSTATNQISWIYKVIDEKEVVLEEFKKLSEKAYFDVRDL